jgi:putative PIN family toxin of toxin-antitoxin system
MAKPRVFLDSSIIIAALLSPQGSSAFILTEFGDRLAFEISDYVLAEVRGILEMKFKKEPRLLAALLPLLGFGGVTLSSNPPIRDVRSAERYISKNDAPILTAAWAGHEYLVTLDNEFLQPNVRAEAERRGLMVLKPGDLIAIVEGRPRAAVEEEIRQKYKSMHGE